jgi:hypothetical protein
MSKFDDLNGEAPLDLSVLDGVAGGTGTTVQQCTSRRAHAAHVWQSFGLNYDCPGRSERDNPGSH